MRILTKKRGFSLIELLIVMAIIGMLMGIMTLGVGEARKSSRDARRKSDLETIRQGIEIYKADCNSYPASGSLTMGRPLNGAYSGGCTQQIITPVDCSAGNACPASELGCDATSRCLGSTCTFWTRGGSSSCALSNTYIRSVPGDPLYPNRVYLFSSSGSSYEICTSLEGGSGTQTCGGSSNCGTGATCNYKVTSP